MRLKRDYGHGDTWQQERQVRLTAQRILAEHLRDDRAKDQRSTDPPSPRFWPGHPPRSRRRHPHRLQPRGGVVADADFRGATFTGKAFFGGTTFTGSAEFGGAAFTGDAWFIDGGLLRRLVQRGDLQRRRPVGRRGGLTAAPSLTPGDLRRRLVRLRRPSPAMPRLARRPSPATPVRRGDLQRQSPVRRDDIQRRRLVRRGDLQRCRRVQRGDLQRCAAFDEGPSAAPLVRRGDLHQRRPVHKVTFGRDATRLTFDRSRVLTPDAEHDWPTGGASGRTAAADTRLSARTTLAVLDLARP